MNTYVKKAGDLAGTMRWSQVLGLFIALAGGVLLVVQLLIQLGEQLQHGSAAMRGALFGASVAAAATALGTLPLLFSISFSRRTCDNLLGFGAGIMLGASAFSLVMPAIAAARAAGAAPLPASAMVGAGVLAGAGLILLLDRISAGAAPLAASGRAGGARRHAWLFVTAVALHNVPEGFAIGVAYAGPELERAHSLATGIAVQDIPEGLVVALALRAVGYGRLFAVGLGMLSGASEPLAAAAGVALISVAHGLLPAGLALAAGAMLYVIVHDVVPESHASGHGTSASAALVARFTLMTILDTALG